jgi:protein phosphatase
MEGDAVPDAQIVDLRAADRLLLCTDGLSNMLDVEVLQNILSTEDDPEKACRALIDQANAVGGRDNITAIVIAV